MKGCEPSLILKVRVFVTRKWSITLIVLCSPLLTLSDEKKKTCWCTDLYNKRREVR